MVTLAADHGQVAQRSLLAPGQKVNRPGTVEVYDLRRMEAMGAPRKYPDEFRERAICLVRDLVDGDDEEITVTGVCRADMEQLGINVDTLRNCWVEQVHLDDGE